MKHQLSGYNNACVYFDTLPAKYVAVWLFELTMVFYVCYVISSHIAMFLEYKRNKSYTYSELVLMRVTMVFDILAFTYSVEIFAVTPKENFVMHTIPFRFDDQHICLLFCTTHIVNVMIIPTHMFALAVP